MNRLKFTWITNKTLLCSYLNKQSVFLLQDVRKPFTNQMCELHGSNIRHSKFSSSTSGIREKTVRNYMAALAMMTLGLAFASVPLYRLFCQITGYGGTTRRESDENILKALKTNRNRKIRIRFVSDVNSNLGWKFKPRQSELQVSPGETALAFYTAKNPTDQAIIGVSTYNVIPFEAGIYFNKIQCFCFEQQLLNPHEEVELPVFFYIDPEFCDDPKMEFVEEIVLSYTFFEAKEGIRLPMPSFLTK